jgi:hypothetical protein
MSLASLFSVETHATRKAKMRRTKRSRTQQPAAAQAQPDLPGREQLLFTSPELQARVGQKHCDEAQLLPLLLAQGFQKNKNKDFKVLPPHVLTGPGVLWESAGHCPSTVAATGALLFVSLTNG